MKRFFPLLLIIALLLTICPNIGIADGVRQSGDFFYKIKGNGTVAITGYTWPGTVEDIYIPRMLDGYTVTEISAEAFANIEYDSYGQYSPCTASFASHYAAGSLVIPDTVTTIGEKAFWGVAFNAKSITIPSSVQYIGAGAFSNMEGVEQFVVASNPVYASIDGVLYHKQSKTLVAFPSDKSFDRSSDYGYRFTIPDGIRAIGDYAFFNIGVRDIVYIIDIPKSVEEIGDWTFAYAGLRTGEIKIDHLTRAAFDLPESVTQIGKGAFYQTGLTYYAFGKRIDASRIQYARIGLENSQLTTLPSYSFFGVNTIQISFPSNIQAIESYAFSNADLRYSTASKDAIVFPSSLRIIEHHAFEKAYLYNQLQFENDSRLEEVGDYAFGQAKYFGEGVLQLPDNLKKIGDGAFRFEQSRMLTAIAIPPSVTTIGDSICDRSSIYLDVEPGSYAALWASENGYMLQQSGQEDMSWLAD